MEAQLRKPLSAPAGSPVLPGAAAGTAADRDSLLRTIGMLEQQRGLLGEAATELALAPLRSRLAALDTDAATDPTVAELPSERKVVTVVFVDIVGFTSMSERLESEAVVDIVNGLFDRLTPVVERYGGTVDKFIGDEIMAVFGAPNAAERHAEHALRTALDIFAALAGYNRDRGLSLELHVGVNTGPVVAGAVGSQTRRQYSVTGDTVNVAARLGSAAAAGRVLVGPSTFRHTSHVFDFEVLEPLPLKGKAKPLPVYRLVGEKSRHANYRDDGLQLSFTGRGAELDRVLARLRSDAPPRGAIGIVAEPGVGKSRLVSELRARVESEVLWIEASAREFRSDVSYGVVHDLLDGVVGLANAGDRDAAATAYAEYLEGIGVERAIEMAPYLFRLRGLTVDPVAEQMLSELAPDVLRQRMEQAVTGLLAAGNGGRAVVLCVEDLHWADSSSISMLRSVSDSPALANALVVFTTRPEQCMATRWIGDLKAAHRQSVIELGPLSDPAVDALLDRAFGSDASWHALRDDIQRKVQGNPLYLVSFLRSLVDEGVATLADGRLELARPVAQISIPDNLQAVVGSRIDRLPRRAKQMLQWASVLGAVFWPRDVARMSRVEGETGPIDATLSLLHERQFVSPGVDGQFRFVHAVVRDVAYDQMLQRDRRRLHLTAAQLFEDEVSPSSEADVALLAWHYERAGERRLASMRYEQAATLASKSHANQEQLRYLESAIELADVTEGARLTVLREEAGDVLHRLGRFTEAVDRFAALRSELSADNLVGSARLHRKIARACSAQIQVDKADEEVEKARKLLDVAGTAGSDDWWREYFAVDLVRLNAYYLRARLAEMAEVIAKLAPQVDAHGTLRERGLFNRSVLLLRMREQRYRPDTATVELAALAAAQLQEAGDAYEACFAAFTHAFCMLWSGATDAATRELTEVLADTVRLGDAERNLLCLTYLAVAGRLRGDVDSAQAFAEAAAAAARSAGSTHYEGMANANLAWVAWRRGDAAAADELMDAVAERTSTQVRYPFVWLHALVGLARAVDANDVAAALAYARPMTDRGQQLLPPPVEAALDAAVDEPTLARLAAVVDASRQVGYL